MNDNTTSQNSASYTVAAFYKFIPLPDYAEMRGPLRTLCDLHLVRGTILLSPEGINGTVAGLPDGISQVLAYLRSDSRLADLEHKESTNSKIPFRRMKVRLKSEIMGLGAPRTNPLQRVGTYVQADDWNALIDDPDVLVIDTRNDYEVAVGTFARAVNPNIKTFRQFTDYVESELDPKKHTKVAMFCTGGIRCEKASSFLLSKGFPEVHHLKGGILKYLETVDPEQSLWRGECFVFDERVALDHDLSSSGLQRCFGCGAPTTDDDRKSPHFEPGISCPACYPTLDDKTRARRAMRQSQHELAKQSKVPPA